MLVVLAKKLDVTIRVVVVSNLVAGTCVDLAYLLRECKHQGCQVK